MAREATVLSSAAGETDPTKFTDLKSSGTVRPDFEVDAVSGLTDNTGGSPYEPGDSILIEITFSGQEDGHAGNLDNTQGNHTFNSSSNIDVKDTSLLPTVEWEVASGAPDGTETIGHTYSEGYNASATDVGVEQTIDIAIEGYNVSVAAAPDSQTEISVDYEITNGDPKYYVDINRKKDASSSFTLIKEETRASEGTYTFSDSGLDSTTEYDYKVEVTDNSDAGTTVSDSDSATTL